MAITLARAVLATTTAILVASCVAAPAHAAGVLAGQWHLDVLGDPSTPDSSGNGLDGAAEGVAVIPGRFGSAFNFDGGRVRVPASAILEPASVTVLAWVQRVGSPGAGRYIVAKGARVCGGSSYAVNTAADGGVQFSVLDTQVTVAVSPQTGTQVWDGEWHALAGTFDGQTVRLYLDGEQVGGGTPAAAPIAYGLSNFRGGNDDFTIGQYPAQALCGAGLGYEGAIDEVRVYDRALSASEVGRLQTAPGDIPPVLQPDPVPPPPAAPPPPATPPPPARPSAPRISAIATVAPLIAGRQALLVAQVQGAAQRVEWDVDGDGRTDVTCDGDETTLRLRPSAGAGTGARGARFDGRLSVHAVGPGGAGPALARTLAVAPAVTPARDARLVHGIAALANRHAPVYACGYASDLPAAGRELTSTTIAGRCFPRTVLAGTLRVEGCLMAIRRLEDIPAAERGVVQIMARALSSPKLDRDSITLGRALDLTDSYVAVGSVLVNGVQLDPHGDARIVVFSQVDQILSSDASMTVGGIKLDNQRDFSLDTRASPNGMIALGSFRRSPGGVRGLGAFALTGDVRVALAPGTAATPAGSQIAARLELPDFLTVGGGRGQSPVKLHVTSDGELVLDDMHIGALDAALGPLGISDLTLDYTGATREWKGQGRLCFAIACLDAVERPGEAPPGGVVIRDGELVRAFVNVDLPDPGIPLFAGVFLTRIGAGIGLNPTRLLGGARVNALGLLQIDGALVLAFPSHAAPFRLTREESGNAFPPDFYGRPHDQFTLAMGGDAYLKVPLIPGRVRLAGGFLLYAAPGYVAFGGDLDFDFFGIVSIQGRATGEVNFETGRFNLGADAHACILDIVCAGAITRVSSVGVGGCVTVSLFGESVSVGGGVQYSPFAVKIWPFDGCKWSRFDEPNVFERNAVAGAAQAGGVRTVRIARGDPSRAIRLDGTDGAPSVRVTGPGGQLLTSSAGPGIAATKTLRILRSEKLKATVVGLVDPVPGTYTIEPLGQSPAIAKLTEAQDPPDAHLRASVRGHGARRTLVYDILRRPDQRVTFVETGPEGDRTIGTVSGGGRGRIAFTPAPGRRPRRIEAKFELAGLPAETTTVATFRPPSALLRRPANVSVRRRGRRLLVAWTRVPEAARYEVVVTLANGGQRLTRTRRNALAVAGVTPTSGGRVAIRAVAPMRQGKVRSVRFRASAPRAPTRFGPLPRGTRGR